MTDMAQADRTLRRRPTSNNNDDVFMRHRQRIRDMELDLVATRLRDCWAIHPRNALGTCGWINGQPWTVQYTKRKPAHIPEEE